ncbi:26S protease regulatory subunit [Blastococcus sp. Marseille-P5729]|uniref:ATP-binding protein n=1 Tax=Blastococcus sp. Marseille-P5729 TaxID=2086582 RepID=UPI000D0F4453|nr:ATP-binding protein [Blastococcus sp. Marseille-P5729]
MSETQIEHGVVGRVAHVSTEASEFFIELRNGEFLGISGLAGSDDVKVGDVVLVNDARVRPAPDVLWTPPAAPTVALVREVFGTRAVIQRDPTQGVVNVDPAKTTVGSTVLIHGDSVEVLSDGATSAPGSSASAGPDPTAAESLSLADFAGNPSVIARARDLIEIIQQGHRFLSTIGVSPPRGVLLSGPPGTGKTFLARIIANEAGCRFFEVTGSQVFRKWYGESQQFLTDLFAEAQADGPSIIYFDEFDAIALARSSESHEESRRIVTQLLNLMSGFSDSSAITVLAATNNPEALDPAIRRIGRFDWEIVFSLPSEPQRREILLAAGSRLRQVGIMPLDYLAHMTEGWSPAELSGIWREGGFLAAAEERDEVSEEDLIGGFERVRAEKAVRNR